MTIEPDLEAKLRRMNAETEKFVAEQRKLIAEAMKLDKERSWFPWLPILAQTAVLLGGTAALIKLLH